MPRIPYCRIFVFALLLALTVVPMAGARSVESPSANHAHAGNWLEAALNWVENLVSPRLPDQKTPQIKSSNTVNGGSCIDPGGHPSPWCGV